DDAVYLAFERPLREGDWLALTRAGPPGGFGASDLPALVACVDAMDSIGDVVDGEVLARAAGARGDEAQRPTIMAHPSGAVVRQRMNEPLADVRRGPLGVIDLTVELVRLVIRRPAAHHANQQDERCSHRGPVLG